MDSFKGFAEQRKCNQVLSTVVVIDNELVLPAVPLNIPSFVFKSVVPSIRY